MTTTASAIAFSGRPDAWLALRSRANASCSLSCSFSMSSPFACSIDLARGERVGERLRLRPQRLQLLVPRPRRRDRREKILLAERLHEVAEHAGLDRARDELLLAVRGEHHDRDGRSSRIRRAASIPSSFGIFTSRIASSGSSDARERDRLLAVLRLGDDLVACALEELLAGRGG